MITYFTGGFFLDIFALLMYLVRLYFMFELTCVILFFSTEYIVYQPNLIKILYENTLRFTIKNCMLK